MGDAQGLSMLYLEARCLAVVRAAGSQGVQNGSISCVALVLAVPGGTRAILGENVLAAWLDLEVASGNDAIASHSEIRKTAKLMGQFLPGTDFVTSGYSVMPRHDNTFGGGNFDADDLDEWLTIQRDWQVDAGIEPVAEDEVLACASGGARGAGGLRRARAPAGLGRRGRGGDRRLRLQRHAGPRPRGRRRGGRRRARARVSGLDVALALDRRGFADVARGGRRHAAPARLGRLPADLGRDRRRRRCALGREQPERLHRPRHRLPARGRALGAAAGAAARRRPGDARRGASRRRSPWWSRASARRRGDRSGGGRRRGRPGVRRRDQRDDQRARPRRRARGDLRGRREVGARRGSCASAAPRTWPSSPTTARGSPARVSRSGSSRRARR